MSQYVSDPVKTFTAGAALAAFTRVKLSSGKLAAAGATDKEIGTILIDVFADGDRAPVLLRNAPGTRKVIAASSATAGAACYTAASGKYDDVQATGAFVAGNYLEAPTADGDIVEMLPNMHGDTAG